MALLLGGSGMKCGGFPPDTPVVVQVPDTVYQAASAAFLVSATAPGDQDLQYVADWGDDTADTTGVQMSGDTVAIRHRWQDAGEFEVRFKAVLSKQMNTGSAWSEPVAVTVLANGIPGVPEMELPRAAVVNGCTPFRATTTDPEGDSVAFLFDFGPMVGVWTGFVSSGGTGLDSHRYAVMETVQVRCKAKDRKGSESDWSAPAELVVGQTGAVVWWWPHDGWVEATTTSPVITLDAGDELCYTSVDLPSKVYGIDVANGRTRRTAGPAYPVEWSAFTGHPAFCATLGHLVIGNEDGELYAFTPSLARIWHWPDSSGENLTCNEWGVPAINGNRIYCTREDDSLYFLTDLGTEPRFEACYGVSGMIDGPVIDNQGNVLIGTDSGYLYKLLPDLSAPVWQIMLSAGDDVHSPAIGADRTIYCGSGSGKVFAVNPDSTLRWIVSLSGEVHRVVVGSDGVFVPTEDGNLYSLDPETGAENWTKSLSSDGLITSPVLAGTDYIYVQDEADRLYCVQQADGELVWTCDCPSYGPGRRSRGSRMFHYFLPQPTITSTGDILVCGVQALYCVAGYDERPLANAPWPKWQHDLYNTGRVSAW